MVIAKIAIYGNNVTFLFAQQGNSTNVSMKAPVLVMSHSLPPKSREDRDREQRGREQKGREQRGHVGARERVHLQTNSNNCMETACPGHHSS